MHYTVKHHVAKISVLLGLLCCIVNYGYRLNQLVLGNEIAMIYIDLEYEDTPESDAEDRSDSSENELEKDKIPGARFTVDFSDSTLALVTIPKVLDNFNKIDLELQTPPPESFIVS